MLQFQPLGLVMRRFASGLLCLLSAGALPCAAQPAVRDYVVRAYKTVGAESLVVHVFNPAKTGVRRAAVVLFHGGGFVWGSPDITDGSAREYAARGIVAFSAQYRLADRKSITPIDQLEDAFDVIRWVRRHADEYGIDPNRVIAHGVSAGGYLATMAAGDKDDAVRPNALVLWSPGVDTGDDPFFNGLLLGRAQGTTLSPMTRMRSPMPPMIIISGALDSVTFDAAARRYCTRATELKSQCELHTYPNLGHLLSSRLDARSQLRGQFDFDAAASQDAGQRIWRFLQAKGFMTSPIGIFEGQTDVGRVGRRGSASYDPQRQEYLVAGSGRNMWDTQDDFQFVWKRLTGNFILSARARFIGAGVDPHRKIGWTIRPSLETSSAHVTAAVHGDGLASLQFRRTSGGVTEEDKFSESLPNPDAVIQLERRDGIYLMSVARFGDTLVTRELTGVSLPDTVYVGLFVCAHNDTVVERAAFTNVRITTPAPRGLVPYRDYIGSNLEILDIATGNATIVHQYRGSFQAPNWTHDGAALMYAQEGRLYRFDLSSRSAAVINTGFATRNNNDHVLSFDGRMLGLSHHAAEDSGASIIYTVPAIGGTPKRVTAKGPSYLHGWSPDGRWLVYTGQRNGELDIYKVPVTGGDEIRLTNAPGLDDGPEFTPDGTYIYFNSSRSGRMQIWRMRPDGSAQEQVTKDGFNNWFPHISPDGKWIAYIAYPPEVAPDDHPFYKHVTLRLMPLAGGPSRVIAYVYGGQGTINVPSWSPDGKRLAFVSNSAMP